MDLTPLEQLIADMGAVVSFGFTQIANVFDLVIENPILLVAVGFSVFGIVVKFGKKMMKL